jgi:hypothetical protein
MRFSIVDCRCTAILPGRCEAHASHPGLRSFGPCDFSPVPFNRGRGGSIESNDRILDRTDGFRIQIS